MNKNLPVKQQTAKITLLKTKSLIGVANKILSNGSGLASVDDSWMQRLWDWADENDVPDLDGLSRNKEQLLKLTNFYYIGSLQTDLPVEICNLTGLTSICMQCCDITGLPNNIGNLSNLIDVCFSANLLTEVPREIGKLIRLTDLSLEENQLENIPDEICDLVNITNLGLGYNQLMELPKKIVNLTSLTYFTLDENPNLILSLEQKEWILTLKENKCDVDIDEDLLSRTQQETTVSNNSKISYDQYKVIEFTDGYDAWEDEATGLMWEVKTQENARYPYVYSKEWIDNAMYPEDLTDDVKDIFSYAQKLNTMQYAGFSDWRVPSKEELETLLTENNFYGNAILGRNTLNLYWTSTSLDDNPSLAYIGAFSTGSVLDIEKNSMSYVRCVRGEYNDI